MEPLNIAIDNLMWLRLITKTESRRTCFSCLTIGRFEHRSPRKHWKLPVTATVRLKSIVYAKTIILFHNCIKTKTRGKLTLKLSLLVLFRHQELRCHCFLKFEEERFSKKKGSSQEAHSFLPARDFYPGYQSPKLNSHWTAQNTRLYMKLNQK